MSIEKKVAGSWLARAIIGSSGEIGLKDPGR